jgi:hypothetical protein
LGRQIHPPYAGDFDEIVDALDAGSNVITIWN